MSASALDLLNQLKIIASCCGGKGVSIWKDSSKQWECQDCGSPKSNDPDYLYGSPKGSDWKPPVWKKASSQCECGSSKVGSDRHSDYCPLYKKV